MKEQREFFALRLYIDELLDGGATIVSRMPLTLRIQGHLFRVQHGMLIGHTTAA